MRETTRAKAARVGLGAAAILLLLGHWLPWAAHNTAALTLSANDLGFFTNFTPGAGIFLNEWFYVLVWVAAILLVVIAYGLSASSRLLLGALSLGVASLGLPRYEQLIKFIRTPLQTLRESEFTLQLVLTLLVMGLALWVLLRPPRLLKSHKANGVLMALAAALCAVPLAGYLGIRPFIAQLYRDDVGIGMGWWLTLLADLLLWAMTFATIIAARSAQQNTHQAPIKPAETARNR